MRFEPFLNPTLVKRPQLHSGQAVTMMQQGGVRSHAYMHTCFFLLLTGEGRCIIIIIIAMNNNNNNHKFGTGQEIDL